MSINIRTSNIQHTHNQDLDDDLLDFLSRFGQHHILSSTSGASHAPLISCEWLTSEFEANINCSAVVVMHVFILATHLHQRIRRHQVQHWYVQIPRNGRVVCSQSVCRWSTAPTTSRNERSMRLSPRKSRRNNVAVESKR